MAKYTPEEIDSVIDQFKEIMNQFHSAQDEFDRGEWGKKFGDRFGKYSDDLKKVNGDDFDILSASYDEKHNDYKDLTEDEYADALEGNILQLLKRIYPDKYAEAKAEEIVNEIENSDGDKTEVHIEAEDKNGDGEISNNEVETHTLDEESKPEDEMATSDARTKRIAKMKSSWTGSPHTSGGRDGQTSDEEQKEPIEEKAKEVADATPNKADDVIVKALTETPEVTEKDEYKDFMDDLKKYSK